jgi:putative membrane protein
MTTRARPKLLDDRARRLLLFLGVPVAAALVASGIAPFDRPTWFLEVAPVLIAAPVIAFTWRRFPLTTLLCVLIALHSLVLILGGTYTYARSDRIHAPGDARAGAQSL